MKLECHGGLLLNTNLLLVSVNRFFHLSALLIDLGLTRSSAEALFLTELCHMEGYGCHRYPAKSEKNEDVILSIGGNSLSVLTLQGRSIHR